MMGNWLVLPEHSQKPAGPAYLSSTSGSLQTTKQQSSTPSDFLLILDNKFLYRFNNLPRTYWTLTWTYSFIYTGFLGIQVYRAMMKLIFWPNKQLSIPNPHRTVTSH